MQERNRGEPVALTRAIRQGVHVIVGPTKEEVESTFFKFSSCVFLKIDTEV